MKKLSASKKTSQLISFLLASYRIALFCVQYGKYFRTSVLFIFHILRLLRKIWEAVNVHFPVNWLIFLRAIDK